MRILMTTDTVGGVWTYTKELASGLLDRGCAVALVSFGRAPSAAQSTWCSALANQWGEAFRYEPSEVPLEWMENNQQAYIEGAAVLDCIASQWQPELLLSSQFCFGALSLPIPKVVVAHSDVLSWAQACRGEKLETSPWLDRYIALVAAGLEAADAVIAPTQWMLSASTLNFQVTAETHVIPNGRTLTTTDLKKSRKLQAVTAGRLWDEAKNIQLLVDVQFSMPLFIAGETTHPSASTTPSLPGATLTGPLAEDDLLCLFSRSAIYICTSKYEPFGLAPLEAALCGCAVLCNDIPSLREVWQDGALFFQDAASLSALLAQLSEDPEMLDQAQQRSLDRAQHFTTGRMVDSYLALFDESLAHPRLRSHVA